MERNPYVLGEMTSQGVAVVELTPEQVRESGSTCACCGNYGWCGGFNVCFPCSADDCESVHPEMIAESEED